MANLLPTQFNSVCVLVRIFSFQGGGIAFEMWGMVKVIVASVHRGCRYLLGPLYEMW